MGKKSISRAMIFISHISEEENLALALSKLIKENFASMLDVFVSTIPLGTVWFEGIERALNECELAIVLASPESVKRPWINFESGAIFSRGKTVIPLCHSGITKNSLPEPLKHLQAVDASDPNGLQHMIHSIGVVLDLNPTSVDCSGFIRLISESESKSNDISEVEIAVLRFTAEVYHFNNKSPRPDRIFAEIANAGFKFHEIAWAISTLVRKKFVEMIDDSEWGHGADNKPYTFERVKLNDKASAWLKANKGWPASDGKPQAPAIELPDSDGRTTPS